MSKKEIHLVFRVINFLYSVDSSKYLITADEHVLLINLASHSGPAGICPSISRLSQELKRHSTRITNTLKKLSDKKLIIIHRNPGKRNYYELTFLEKIESEKDENYTQTPSVRAMGNLSTTPSVDATTPLAPTLHTPSVDATLSLQYQSNNQLRERENTLSKNNSSELEEFKPIEQHQELCIRLGITNKTAIEELQSFKKRHSGKGDLDYEFMRWLKDGHERRKNSSINTHTADNKSYQQSHPTLPDLKTILAEREKLEEMYIPPSNLLLEHLSKKINGVKRLKNDCTEEIND